MFIDHGHLGYDAYLFAILKFSLGRMLYAKKIMLFFMNNIWEREKKIKHNNTRALWNKWFQVPHGNKSSFTVWV